MKPSRRWFQYSLRSFLVLLTALAVWLGIVVNRARDQREAVKAIEALGGYVTYDWQINVFIVGKPKVLGKPSGPEWLRKIIGDDFFQEVEKVKFVVEPNVLEVSPPPLASIPHLKRLRGLKTVVLYPSLSNYDVVESQLQHALPHCEVRKLRPMGLR